MTKKEGVEIVGDRIRRVMAGKTMKCKTCQGVENKREDRGGREMGDVGDCKVWREGFFGVYDKVYEKGLLDDRSVSTVPWPTYCYRVCGTKILYYSVEDPFQHKR
jgi:hypothetical protein